MLSTNNSNIVCFRWFKDPALIFVELVFRRSLFSLNSLKRQTPFLSSNIETFSRICGPFIEIRNRLFFFSNDFRLASTFCFPSKTNAADFRISNFFHFDFFNYVLSQFLPNSIFNWLFQSGQRSITDNFFVLLINDKLCEDWVKFQMRK